MTLSSEVSEVYNVLEEEDKCDHFLDFLDLDFSHISWNFLQSFFSHL